MSLRSAQRNVSLDGVSCLPTGMHVDWFCLEAESHAEAERPLIASRFAAGVRDAVDDHELAAVDVRAGIAKMGRVAEVQHFGSELCVQPLCHPAVAEQAEIEVHQPRPAKCIEARRPESGIRHWGKSRRVIKRRGSNATQLLRWLDLVSTL